MTFAPVICAPFVFASVCMQILSFLFNVSHIALAIAKIGTEAISYERTTANYVQQCECKKKCLNKFVCSHVSAKDNLDFSAETLFSAGYRERTMTLQILHYQNYLIGMGTPSISSANLEFSNLYKIKWHGKESGDSFFFYF